MKKKTSVEWLVEQLGIEEIVSDCKKEYRDRYIEKINQAKEIHKNEHRETWIESSKSLTNIVDVNKSFDIYYKNTYEKEN